MTRTILISGASRGIGLETSRLLAAKDSAFDQVVMIARDSDDFSAAVAELQADKSNKEVIAIPADLSDPDMVDVIYDELDKRDVRVSTILNNAGFTKPASVNETKLSRTSSACKALSTMLFLLIGANKRVISDAFKPIALANAMRLIACSGD